MRILGVDPGTINLGYGVVDGEEEMHMVDCGVVNLSARLPMEERLRSLYSELSRAILAAANKGLPVYYYSPAKIKKQITSYGQSDKQQVQEMVRVQLGLSELPQPSDAADALAVAMCHIQQRRLSQWVTEHTPE
jgi:crossover junction endodeoxyribonuclease RuvC